MRRAARAVLIFFIWIFPAFVAVGVAGAQVQLQNLHWQVAARSPRPGGKPLYHDAQQWLRPPDARAAGQIRAMVTLVNRSTRSEEAVLLRYAVSARLAPVAGESEGVWTVPFLLEEKHIPKVKAGGSREVPIPLNRTVFGAYLRRKGRTELWPDALRIQVMIEPRSGETSLEGRVADSTMKILWKQPAAGGGK